jgi:general secretion pathway protein M
MTGATSLARFWSERSPRERRLLRLWGICLIVAAVFAFGVAPAVDGIERLERSMPALRHRAAALQSLVAEAKQLQQATPVATPEGAALLGALAQSAHGASLNAQTPTVLSNGDIHMTFDHESFGAWVAWLADAEHRLGVRARSVHARLSADRRPDGPGVDIDLVLAPVARAP